MLDFICPACGLLSFDEPSCSSCGPTGGDIRSMSAGKLATAGRPDVG